MNYTFSEQTFQSSDAIHTIYTEIYTPKSGEIKGIVQLAHGMIDYTGRYLELADYLTAHGYVFAGNHALGHGKSVLGKEDYGYFADNDGYSYVLKDLHTVNRYLRHTYPSVPLVLLGHSMGSFIARLYAVEHPHHIQGLIIHGTGGSNPLLPMGRALAKMLKKMYGPRHRSNLLKSLAFGSYNKRFPKNEGEWAWLSRDKEAIADRDTNEFTSFKFTTSGYVDLFHFLGESNSKEWYSSYPKNMPTLIVSGDADPVGDYGKGPKEIYKKLMLEGCTALTLKLYEGARHELFNETCRMEVFADLVSWIDGVR